MSSASGSAAAAAGASLWVVVDLVERRSSLLDSGTVRSSVFRALDLVLDLDGLHVLAAKRKWKASQGRETTYWSRAAAAPGAAIATGRRTGLPACGPGAPTRSWRRRCTCGLVACGRGCQPRSGRRGRGPWLLVGGIGLVGLGVLGVLGVEKMD